MINIYTVSILFAIGAASRMSYFQAQQVVNDIWLQISSSEISSKEDIRRNAYGALIGTLLLMSTLIYGFLYYKWLFILYCLGSAIVSLIILNVIRFMLGGFLSRLLFI